ncbi:hypothetical protein JW933_10525 [candidate division FCPU426 bacterium]|nr:hypothetical protein [candidate division FCPU426 bacterium]
MEPIYSQHAPEPIGPYSQAVRCGGLLILSGQIPLDPVSGKLVAGDIRIQTRRVLENIGAVLVAAGITPAQVVKTTVYMADLAEFPVVNEVYAEFFGQNRPARSTIQAAALPAGARLEIDAIAALPARE